MASQVSSLESVGLSDPEPAVKAYFAHLIKSAFTASSPEIDEHQMRKKNLRYTQTIPKEKMSKKHIFGESKSKKNAAYERIDVGPAKMMREKILAASLFPSVYAK